MTAVIPWPQPSSHQEKPLARDGGVHRVKVVLGDGRVGTPSGVVGGKIAEETADEVGELAPAEGRSRP